MFCHVCMLLSLEVASRQGMGDPLGTNLRGLVAFDNPSALFVRRKAARVGLPDIWHL